LLQDDLADLKNQLETTSIKYRVINEKYEAADKELQFFHSNQQKMNELEAVFEEVQSNGENYLQMMKEMKQQLKGAIG
jgi:uncharacterized protein involved in exopolysaccharide biosynthesis